MKLTEKQQQFLEYISGYIESWGQAPSFDEICAHFGFNSYNTVTTYLKILERKGYIRRPRKNLKRALKIIRPGQTRRFELPLLGRVAAGKPIEAVEDTEVVEVPPSMIGRGDFFALKVKGRSMEEDGILSGDIIVVKRQSTAENGETVVALIDNEVTVKKYYRRPDHIELRPAHQGMDSLRIKEGNLQIQGKVVGVIRHYK